MDWTDWTVVDKRYYGRGLAAKGWCEMTVQVWFVDAWGPYAARAVAEVTESLAESLVSAGVAVVVDVMAAVVDGLDEADGSDGSEKPQAEGAPEPEVAPEAEVAAKPARRPRR
jgi:hypothetical protein